MPVWQDKFEAYRDKNFTVLGIALDVEGITPAKRYYDRFGVTFPSLVDPNYATQFGAVPKTFFVNEHGVVQPLQDWELRLDQPLKPVTDEVRRQWSRTGEGEAARQTAQLAMRYADDTADLVVATELASRYLARGLTNEAERVLRATVSQYDAHTIAVSVNSQRRRLLGQAYLQYSRAVSNDQATRVRYATLSYYLQPSVGFAKQIARLIAPAKFDGRPGGDFDNAFREGTRRRLERERQAWLRAGDGR